MTVFERDVLDGYDLIYQGTLERSWKYDTLDVHKKWWILFVMFFVL